jgi:hypothetical protein
VCRKRGVVADGPQNLAPLIAITRALKKSAEPPADWKQVACREISLRGDRHQDTGVADVKGSGIAGRQLVYAVVHRRLECRIHEQRERAEPREQAAAIRRGADVDREPFFQRA